MPNIVTLRRTTAVIFAACAVSWPTVQAVAGAAPTGDPTTPAEQCGPSEVTVVVDFNELGGETRASCVAGPGTAQQLLEAAGHELATATAPGMEGFVCRLDGRPANGPCTRSDSYWSLWSADTEARQWAYATLGARDLEVEPGAYVGFAWHQGSGQAAAPDVAISGDGGLKPEADEETAAVEAADDDDKDGPPTWLLAGGAAALLGAAGFVAFLRGRAREPS